MEKSEVENKKDQLESQEDNNNVQNEVTIN